MRENAVDQMGGGIRHPPPATGRAKTPAIAGERDEFIPAAGIAAQAQEAARQDVALQKRAQFLFDEPRNMMAVLPPTCEKRLQMLRQHTVQHRPFGMTWTIRVHRV